MGTMLSLSWICHLSMPHTCSVPGARAYLKPCSALIVKCTHFLLFSHFIFQFSFLLCFSLLCFFFPLFFWLGWHEFWLMYFGIHPHFKQPKPTQSTAHMPIETPHTSVSSAFVDMPMQPHWYSHLPLNEKNFDLSHKIILPHPNQWIFRLKTT